MSNTGANNNHNNNKLAHGEDKWDNPEVLSKVHTQKLPFILMWCKPHVLLNIKLSFRDSLSLCNEETYHMAANHNSPDSVGPTCNHAKLDVGQNIYHWHI